MLTRCSTFFFPDFFFEKNSVELEIQKRRPRRIRGQKKRSLSLCSALFWIHSFIFFVCFISSSSSLSHHYIYQKKKKTSSTFNVETTRKQHRIITRNNGV